jgi:hypothetical protein
MKILILGMIAVLGMSGAHAKDATELLVSQETNYSEGGPRPICRPGQTRQYIYDWQGNIVGWRCVSNW